MEDTVPFGSKLYFLMFALLVFSRGMDFLSTWVATPNLVLEGNPIAKKLGWTWGLIVNVAVVFLLAMWPVAAIVVSTASVMVAARNFQSAWLMRTLGEHSYRDWHVERVQETRISVYLFCLFGNTLLTAGVGFAIILFSRTETGEWPLVLVAIGMGIVSYALAVVFYTLLAIWRLRRAMGLTFRAFALIRPDSPGPDLATCAAGASPNRMPVIAAAAAVKSRTVVSMRTSSIRGRSAGANRRSIGRLQNAITTPSAPPSSASSMLSASSWRTRRNRSAPRADRMAISRYLETPRPRRRLATFTHAMSSTTATVTNTTARLARTCSTIRSCTPTTATSGLLV